jgi:RNA polymerase primary sigma factor
MAAAAEARGESDDDEDDAQSGPDPVEAKKRFAALKRQCTKTEKAIAGQGP